MVRVRNHRGITLSEDQKKGENSHLHRTAVSFLGHFIFILCISRHMTFYQKKTPLLFISEPSHGLLPLARNLVLLVFTQLISVSSLGIRFNVTLRPLPPLSILLFPHQIRSPYHSHWYFPFVHLSQLWYILERGLIM